MDIEKFLFDYGDFGSIHYFDKWLTLNKKGKYVVWQRILKEDCVLITTTILNDALRILTQ